MGQCTLCTSLAEPTAASTQQRWMTLHQSGNTAWADADHTEMCSRQCRPQPNTKRRRPMWLHLFMQLPEDTLSCSVHAAALICEVPYHVPGLSGTSAELQTSTSAELQIAGWNTHACIHGHCLDKQSLANLPDRVPLDRCLTAVFKHTLNIRSTAQCLQPPLSTPPLNSSPTPCSYHETTLPS